MNMDILQAFVEVLETQQRLTIEQFMGLILAKARRMTGAEAGSIFLVRPLGSNEPTELYACSTQNDAVHLRNENFTMPADKHSIAGYVAVTGEVVEIENLYELDGSVPFAFNRSFDDKSGYHSKSMLAFPLKNFDGTVVGVVQLINHIDKDGKAVPFPLKHVDEMKSVINMLGVIVERTDLMNEVMRLRDEIAELKRNAA